MRNVSIVAPLGTSPPVITEFLQYVEEVLDQRVTDLTIISTREPVVLDGLELVKVAVEDHYPKVNVHVVELPYEDVDSEERSREFIKTAANILNAQNNYGIDIIHLCVAGGRKEVCIILSLLAQFYSVNGVYHVVMPDVKTFNQQLELIRYEAGELAQVEDKLTYYRQKKHKLEPVLYPPLSDYNVIKIPIIPYPMRPLLEIKEILKSRKIELTPTNSEMALRLNTLGYLTIAHNTAYLTTEGEHLSDILQVIVGP